MDKRTIALVWALFSITARAGEPESPTARIEVGADAVRLKLQVPAACWPLAFRLPAAAGIDRKAWTVEGCAALANDRLESTDARCAGAVVRIPAVESYADRIDPPATPVQGLGLWVNTSAMQLASTCGPVRWNIDAAPGASLVVRGVDVGSSWQPAAAAPAGFLPPAFFHATPSADRLAIGANVSASRREVITRAMASLGSLFAPVGQGAVPFVAVAQLPSARGRPTFQGGAPDERMIQLQLFEGPDAPERDLSASIRGVLAHEWAHLLPPRSPGRWPAVALEGHAEAARVWASRRLGWIDGAGAQAEIARMANACLLAVGVGPIADSDVLARGRPPYDCGGVLALLSAHAQALQGQPWLDVLSRSCDSAPCLFASVAEMTGSGAGMGEQITRSLEKARLEPRRRALRTDEVARVRMAMFSSWMREDCGKSVGFETLRDALKISRMRGCATYRDGMEIVGAEGLSLFDGDVGGTLQTLAQACTRQSTVRLQLRDGGTLAVPCARTLVPPAMLYEFDESAGPSLDAVWLGPPEPRERGAGDPRRPGPDRPAPSASPPPASRS